MTATGLVAAVVALAAMRETSALTRSGELRANCWPKLPLQHTSNAPLVVATVAPSLDGDASAAIPEQLRHVSRSALGCLVIV